MVGTSMEVFDWVGGEQGKGVRRWLVVVERVHSVETFVIRALKKDVIGLWVKDGVADGIEQDRTRVANTKLMDKKEIIWYVKNMDKVS